MTTDELLLKIQAALPGEKAHAAFMPSRGNTSIKIKEGVPYKESAVAIILFHDLHQRLKMVVTKRQEYDGSHSGQISFPGGKRELQDENLIDTAKRECFEEIGIDGSQYSFLKELSPVYIPVSQFLVSPYLFYSKAHLLNYHRNQREVKEIIEIDLQQLFDESSIVYHDVKVNHSLILKRVPHFKQDEVLIWGATALMINELKWLLQ
ncbi:MAG TPA: CoA pyrophosphatase [Fluviicola sp.]|nr:CoA pyrophosphatase [Fluviicola sp.]